MVDLGAVIMKNHRFNWLAPAAASLVAAAVGGWVGWYALNNVGGAFIGASVAGGLVGMFVDSIRSHRQARALRAELHEVARGLGLAYEEGDVEVFPGARPKQPFGDEWSRCQNRLSGTSDGVPAHMFDLTTTSPGPGDKTDSRWTAVLFQQTHLPEFVCIPKSWSTVRYRRLMSSVILDPEVGDQMTRQAVADFQIPYELCVPKTAVRSHEDEVRRLFLAPRLEALARCPGWYVQSSATCLLFARSGTAPAANRPALWHEAIEIRRALLAPVSSAAMSIPVAPGMERDRQSNRQGGRSWGRLSGTVLGLFGGFIAFSVFMFSRMGPAGPGHRPSALHLMPLVFFGSTLGGLLIGTVVGTWLGGRLADRSYRPTPDGAPAPTIGINDAFGWVVAGAFAGFVLGAVIGMGLATVLARVIPFHWVMPIVFLSPPVLCLLLGGFAGYRVARRRADRRK
jgi:hypothetical protein